MKTKHLLFAAALPLAFAACQNEEFAPANSPELSNEQRPLVEVNLDFQKGDAETRVNYDGNGYSWQSTDKIGALLMDTFKSKNRPFGATAEAWEKETWYEHYELIDGIHTAYPFAWNATSKAWEAPSKLQEGNYFFAAPYDSYQGERQLVHNLDSQMQTGGTEKDMNKAISDNQYFIGYAQIKAGAENKEALKSVIMAPVLAPVKVTLRNIGTVAKNIEKVVIYGDQVATSLTINPTEATYGGTDEDGSIKAGQAYNLNEDGSTSTGNTDIFNYANLIGATEDEYKFGTDVLVHNVASGAEDYKQGDALRQIVHPIYSEATADDAPAYEKQAVLSFSKPVNVASKGEINFAVMVNTIPEVTTGKLTMDLIFTEGRITTIDLTKINEDENAAGGLKPNTVLTNIEIKSLKPSTKNELIVQFDNNSVVKAQTMNVQDATELLAFINWNAENARKNTVTLLKDVTFTKEMYDAIAASTYKGELVVKGSENAKLLVADNVPTDVLNKLDATTDATIVLDGTRELTKAIADGLKDAKMTIENRGEVSVKQEVVAYTVFENYGKVVVSKDGEFKGTTKNNIKNYGMLENNGKINNVVNDVKEDAKGWIKTSATLNHIVSNAKGATIQLTDASHAITGMTEQKGTIFLETAKGVTAKVLNDQKVTKLTVTGGTIDFNNLDNATVKELTINGEVKLEGWDASNPRKSTYHKFTGVEKASISGKVSFTNAGIEGTSATTVNSDAALTFVTLAKFNDITFIKGATATVNDKAAVEVKNVVWNNNNINNYGKFEYVTSETGKVNVVAGNPTKEKEPTTPDPEPAEPVSVTIVATESANEGEYTLEELYEAKNAKTNAIKIKDITISTAINAATKSTTILKDEEDNTSGYTYGELLKDVATGKKVTLSGTSPSITKLNDGLDLSFEELAIAAGATGVEVGGSVKNVVVLTVNKIDLGTNLKITDSFVQLNEAGIEGNGTSKISGTGTINGTIVDSSKTLKWDNDKWTKLVP